MTNTRKSLASVAGDRADDIKLILEHLAQTNPKAREIQPAALIYNDLVDNVARSGHCQSGSINNYGHTPT
jgi:hypothetical protein